MNTKQADLIVGNAHGVHGRVATRLAEIAASHGVKLAICRGEENVCCSSILDILALALLHGTPVRVVAEGAEADAALQAAIELLTAREDP